MCLYGFAFELSYSLFVGRGSVYAWLALHPCKALGHTCPASMPGLSVGLPPSPRLGLRPKPHFQKLYRFIDSLSRRKTACLNNHRTSQFIMPKTDILAKSLSVLSQAVSSELSLPVSSPPKSPCSASNIANFIS